jgi:hypothetical protein
MEIHANAQMGLMMIINHSFAKNVILNAKRALVLAVDA